VLAGRILALCCAAALTADATSPVQVTWEDVTAFHARLEAVGITRESFSSQLDRMRLAHSLRVREGDLDHLVFYLLQSTRFTPLPPIEPALSAKAVHAGDASNAAVPADVRARIAALLRAIDSTDTAPRLAYFRAVVSSAFTDRSRREAALGAEYLRVMRFVYEKEFVAQRSARPADAVAALYRSRGLSTDTAVEAGFLVYQGLGVLGSLDPSRRVRRVLIVGPGLDLAPRTAMQEAGPPQSYQPWAVIDALLAVGLSRADDLEVVAADVNLRVVDHIGRARSHAPVLILASEIHDSDTVRLSVEYREYFSRLGGAIGDATVDDGEGQLRKKVRVRPEVASRLRAVQLDIALERLPEAPFDVIVATNILPYMDDVELMLAVSNVAAMLAPGGAFLHNEARPLLGELTSVLGLPLAQSRHAIIATVKGAPAPLADSVWLHRKAPAPTH
jgi:hypothetical protein